MSKFPGQCVCISFSSFLFYPFLSSLPLFLLVSFWPFGPFLKRNVQTKGTFPYFLWNDPLPLHTVHRSFIPIPNRGLWEEKSKFWKREAMIDKRRGNWIFNIVEISCAKSGGMKWNFRNLKILKIWISLKFSRKIFISKINIFIKSRFSIYIKEIYKEKNYYEILFVFGEL